jgi:hypothetical protein
MGVPYREINWPLALILTGLLIGLILVYCRMMRPEV